MNFHHMRIATDDINATIEILKKYIFDIFDLNGCELI